MDIALGRPGFPLKEALLQFQFVHQEKDLQKRERDYACVRPRSNANQMLMSQHGMS